MGKSREGTLVDVAGIFVGGSGVSVAGQVGVAAGARGMGVLVEKTSVAIGVGLILVNEQAMSRSIKTIRMPILKNRESNMGKSFSSFFVL